MLASSVRFVHTPHSDPPPTWGAQPRGRTTPPQTNEFVLVMDTSSDSAADGATSAAEPTREELLEQNRELLLQLETTININRRLSKALNQANDEIQVLRDEKRAHRGGSDSEEESQERENLIKEHEKSEAAASGKLQKQVLATSSKLVAPFLRKKTYRKSTAHSSGEIAGMFHAALNRDQSSELESQLKIDWRAAYGSPPPTHKRLSEFRAYIAQYSQLMVMKERNLSETRAQLRTYVAYGQKAAENEASLACDQLELAQLTRREDFAAMQLLADEIQADLQKQS